MSGIGLDNGVLTVDREPNQLDRLAIDVSNVLTDLDVEHVLVAGYVAILAGRPRGTEDIDLLIEKLDSSEVDELARALQDAGFWGSAMPLDDMDDTLAAGTNVRVAQDGEVIPNVEMKYVEDQFDRASLRNTITAQIGEHSLPIGQLELQIAYKLFLDTQKDFEDAVHLYTLFEESLSKNELETWVRKLDARDQYDRLRRA